jgi:hypothetical protein
MVTPQKYVNGLINGKEFSELNTTVAEYLEKFADKSEKLNAVKAIIGERNISSITPGKLLPELKKNYGWEPSPLAAGHFIYVLKNGPMSKPRGCILY